MTEATIKDVQQYWDRRPCNIRHSQEPVGTKEYFDQVEQRKYFVEPHIPGFADFPRWRGKKVLEIGCGIGTDTINFARAGALVTAVDVSEESLKIARQRAEVMGVSDRIEFIHANAEDPMYLFVGRIGEKFDLIYSFGVIHHSPHPEWVLRTMRVFSKPGTIVKIMVYNKWSWKVLWILLKHGGWSDIPAAVAKWSEAQTGCPVTFTYSKKEMAEMLMDAGFLPVENSIEHIFPYSIPEYVDYQYKKVWYFRWMPEALFHWLEHRIGWHLCITAVVK